MGGMRGGFTPPGSGGGGSLDTAAVDARAGRIVGAEFGVTLTMREDAVLVLTSQSLTSNALMTPDPLLYDDGALTLTLPLNGNFNTLSGGSWSLGDRFLWRFTDADGECGGVYTLTDLGTDDPGGSPAVWTRAADFDASGDFVAGASVIARDFGGTVGLYRLNVSESFVLGTNDAKFDLIDPAYLVTAGTP